MTESVRNCDVFSLLSVASSLPILEVAPCFMGNHHPNVAKISGVLVKYSHDHHHGGICLNQFTNVLFSKSCVQPYTKFGS